MFKIHVSQLQTPTPGLFQCPSRDCVNDPNYPYYYGTDTSRNAYFRAHPDVLRSTPGANVAELEAIGLLQQPLPPHYHGFADFYAGRIGRGSNAETYESLSGGYSTWSKENQDFYNATVRSIAQSTGAASFFTRHRIAAGDLVRFRAGSSFAPDIASSATTIFGYWLLAPVPYSVNAAGTVPITLADAADAAQWGMIQAKLAIAYARGGPYNRAVNGRIARDVFFVDVEYDPANNAADFGLTSQALRRSILEGFLGELAANGTPGVYTSTSGWEAWFGQGYAPTQGFVLWTADRQLQSALPANTSSLLPQCQTLDNFFCDLSTRIGGQIPVIWQYAGGLNASGGDWNVTWQPPSGLYVPTGVPPFCTYCAGTATPTPAR